MTRILYATLMGLYLAVTQTGLFFQLEIWLTAAYPSFVTVMVAWLTGAVAGLLIFSRGESRPGIVGLWGWLLASAAAYYLCLALLKAFPYNLWLLPVHGLLIIVCGAQAGSFFAANRGLFGSAARLFFFENNGFTLGWAVGFFGFVLYGSMFNYTAPGALCVMSGAAAWAVYSNKGKSPAGLS